MRYCKKLTHFVISIAVLEKVHPDTGLQKRAAFFFVNAFIRIIISRSTLDVTFDMHINSKNRDTIAEGSAFTN
jgi:hypothetical protein